MKITGENLVLTKDSTAIAHTNSFTLSINQDVPEATTMDSNQWAEFLVGERTWSISFEGLTTWGSNGNVDVLSELILDNNRSSETISFTTNNTGDVFFSGSAILTSFEVAASRNEAASYSGEFQGTGPLAKAIVAGQ